MIKRHFLHTACAAAFGLAAAAPSMAQQVIKMSVAAGHPPVFLWVKLTDEVFIPEVDKRLAAAGGKYKIDWTKAWGGTLMKLGTESKGVADGVADIAIVSTIFEAAKFPLQNVTYYTPFGSDDVGVINQTMLDLQKSIPAMADAWTKNGLVFLNGMALDSYHIWTKFPVTRIEDLQGKKLSAPGPSANWVKGTGAVAVAGSLNSYYEDIKSGVSDGALVFATGAWGAKLHEVAPYITKVNFGAMFAGGLAMNKCRLRQAAARGAEGAARSRRRVGPAVREDPGRGRRHGAAEHGRRRRQDQRTQPGRTQALGRLAGPRGQDLGRRRHGQGRAGQRGAEGLHGRTAQGRHAAAARLVQ